MSGLAENARNPTDWKALSGKLGKPSKIVPKQPHAAMPWEDVPECAARLRAIDNIAARILEFAVLHGTRTKPVLHMTWAQIDLFAREWSVPGLNEKSGSPLKVPLADRAMAILLERLPADVQPDDFVFAGQKGRRAPRAAMTCWKLLRKMGIAKGLATVHGFRSALSTWAGEVTSHDRD